MSDLPKPPDRVMAKKRTTIGLSTQAHAHIKMLAGDDVTLVNLMEVLAQSYPQIMEVAQITGLKPVDILQLSLKGYCDHVKKSAETGASNATLGKVRIVGAANNRIEQAVRRCIEDGYPISATQIQKLSGSNYNTITRYLELPTTKSLIEKLQHEKAVKDQATKKSEGVEQEGISR